MRYAFVFLFLIGFKIICCSQSSVFDISKTLSLADYINCEHLTENYHTKFIVETSYLESKGFYDVDFIKIKIRNMTMLKVYFNYYYLKNTADNLLNLDTLKYRNDFINQFDIKYIDDIAFYENKIGKEKFTNNLIRYQCDFVLAYLKSENSFIRVKGFRLNEFRELLGKNNHLIVNLKGVKRSKIEQSILKQIEIDEVDKKYILDNFIKKKKVIDKDACYYRDKFTVLNGIGNVF